MTNILVFKNFSSLKAIISGLQSNPIYRLKRAWSYVLREKLEIFEELARIFSGENNALAQRELLVREGTARFADTVGENDHHMQKILQKHSENSRVRTNLLQIFYFCLIFCTEHTPFENAKLDIFEELARIFLGENNALAQ